MQDALFDTMMQDAPFHDKTCDKLKTIAFSSHVDCYDENGFCDLAFDYKQLGKTSDFIKNLYHVYEVKDFAKLLNFKQVY